MAAEAAPDLDVAASAARVLTTRAAVFDGERLRVVDDVHVRGRGLVWSVSCLHDRRHFGA